MVLATGKRVALGRDAKDVDTGRDGAALAVASVPLIGLVTGRGGCIADEGDPVASQVIDADDDRSGVEHFEQVEVNLQLI